MEDRLWQTLAKPLSYEKTIRLINEFVNLYKRCCLRLQKRIKANTFYNKDNSYFHKSAAELILTEKVPILHRIQKAGNHFAMGKVPSLYIAGTAKIPSVCWEENLQIQDHQDFFWRADGNLDSVSASGTDVFHYHNPFQKHYQKCRHDIEGDRKYITQKREKKKKEDFHLT